MREISGEKWSALVSKYYIEFNLGQLIIRRADIDGAERAGRRKTSFMIYCD